MFEHRRTSNGSSKKVQVGNDQERRNQKKIPIRKTEAGKKQNNNKVLIPLKHFVSRMSSYFPNRWPLSYPNITKNMITYIRRQQHKKFKHQGIKPKEVLEKCKYYNIKVLFKEVYISPLCVPYFNRRDKGQISFLLIGQNLKML